MTAPEKPRSCPDPERLATFFEGTLDEASQTEIARHVEGCDWCLFALRQAAGFEQDQEHSARWRLARLVALAAGFVVAIVAVATFIGSRREIAVSRLAAAARQAQIRPFEGRIAEFDAERFSNTRSQSRENAVLVAVANGILADNVNPRSEADRRAVSLAQLVAGRTADAVRGLEELTRIDPQSSRHRSDLATARIALAAATNDAAELRRALADADEALRLDPTSLDALFDRALAFERLGANTEAAAAYDAYLHRDSTSAWAAEARWRLSRLRP